MRTVIVNCRVISAVFARTGKAVVLNLRVSLPNSCPYPFPPDDPEPEEDDNA